jgi:hypothetical protein
MTQALVCLLHGCMKGRLGLAHAPAILPGALKQPPAVCWMFPWVQALLLLDTRQMHAQYPEFLWSQCSHMKVAASLQQVSSAWRGPDELTGWFISKTLPPCLL